MQESQLLLAASFQRHISCIFSHTAQTDAKMNLQELQVYNLEQKICVILRPNMILINYERSQRLSDPKHAKTLCLVCLLLAILQVIFTQLVNWLLNVYKCDLQLFMFFKYCKSKVIKSLCQGWKLGVCFGGWCRTIIQNTDVFPQDMVYPRLMPDIGLHRVTDSLPSMTCRQG